MPNWKESFYSRYVSTGQSSINRSFNKTVSNRSCLIFKKLIKNHFPSDKNAKILDLGCGYGAFLYCLNNNGFTDLHGIDASKEHVSIARDRGIPNVENLDLFEFLDQNTLLFDVVLLIDVLEHFSKEEVMTILKGVFKSLNDGGTIVIHVPNAEGIFGMRSRYGDFTHEVCFTQQSLKQVLSVSKFQEIETKEDSPVIHGVISLVRFILWHTLTLPRRLLFLAETGSANCHLSQNILATAKKLSTENKNH